MSTKKAGALLFIILTSFIVTLLHLSHSTANVRNTQTPISTNTSVTATTTSSSQTDHRRLREIQYSDYRMVIRDLILSHPHPEIRTGFYQAIDSGALNYVTTDTGEMVSSAAVAVFMILPGEDGSLIRGMQIDIQTVMNPTISAEFIQLVLLHEYQHYLQSLRPDEPLHTMMRQPPESFEQQTPADIRKTFDNEVEAYAVECEFADDVDWLWAADICQVYTQTGPTEFRRVLIREYMQQPAWAVHEETLRQMLEE